MYQIGDLIVYGTTGVCEVVEITTLDNMRDVPKDKLHYKLKPLYENCEIYTPVENSKVFVRPVISQAEAEALVDEIPTCKAEPYFCTSMQQLKDHYKACLDTHACRDLVELTMSLHAKKAAKKFNQVDDTYMKRAESLLFGELAVALQIPFEEVTNYIQRRVEAYQSKQAAEETA